MHRNYIIILFSLIIVAIVAVVHATRPKWETFLNNDGTATIDLPTSVTNPRNEFIYHVLRQLVLSYIPYQAYKSNPEVKRAVQTYWAFLPSTFDIICSNVTVEDDSQRKLIDSNCKNLFISEFSVNDQRSIPKLSPCDEMNYTPRKLTKLEDVATMIIDDMKYTMASSCFDVSGASVNHQPFIPNTDFSDGFKVFFKRSPTWMLLARPLVIEIPMVGFFTVNYDLNEDTNIMNSYHSLDYTTKNQATNLADDKNRCLYLSLTQLPAGFEKYNVNYASSSTTFNNAFAQSLQNSRLYSSWKLYYTIPYGMTPNVQLNAYHVMTLHINPKSIFPSAGAIINSPVTTSDYIQKINVVFGSNHQLSISVNLTSSPTDQSIIIDTTSINEAIAAVDASNPKFDVLITFALNTITIVAFYQTPDGDQYVRTLRKTLKTKNGPIFNLFFCFKPEKKDQQNSYINIEPSQITFATPNYAHKAMDFNYTNIV
jgi:hypothetical protein